MGERVTPSLVLFAVVGALLIASGARLGRVAFAVGAIPMASALAWTGVHLGDVTSGRAVTEHVSWVPSLGLSLDLRLDGLAATMTLIVTGIGLLVLWYAARYFDAATADLGRLAGLLVLFAGAMVGVVQSDHLLLLYTCWEVTSITSYLLIGNQHTDRAARAAALHALLVTAAGGLAMLGGFVLLGQAAGTYRLSELASAGITNSPQVTAAAVLILIGAFTKSAQYPFHSWLPGAMAAPTPVSAYLHSATMVKAGVYLVARFAPIAAVAVPVWRPLVLVVGLVTLVAGGLRALRQNDLKLLLAFGTVSQLGLMVVLFGAGTPEATTAGWTLLVAHALFKAALFMVVGVVDHETGTRDRRRLPALGRDWWWVEAATVLSAASMAGLPFLIGFVAKEGAYGAFTGGPFQGSAVVLAATVAGSMLTVAYSATFWWSVFPGPRHRATGSWVDVPTGADGSPLAVPAPAWTFGGAAALLATGSLFLGLAPGVGDRLATAALRGLGIDGAAHLALWHGFELPLLLSAITIAGGLAVFVGLRPVQRVLAAGTALPSGTDVYGVLLSSIGTASRRVTGVVQNGSLPVYSGVILATAAVLPGAALVSTWVWTGWPEIGSAGQAAVAVLLLVVATGAATVRRRFSAALLLGAAGYSMAGLFVLAGAPDLALTQAAVETLSTVVFVLVLRRLPDRFERQSTPRRRVLRVAIAVTVGVMVFVVAIVASGSRIAPTDAGEMVERALPDGHGRNIVNVILVDFRGVDTMGEITVLAVASIGAVALARVGRRTSARPEPKRPTRDVKRVVFVDVSVRLIFHLVLAASLWLLFAGHNQPGGGFVGGLLAGSAITLRYVAGGIDEVRGRSRFKPWTVLGTGLLLASVTEIVPALAGGSPLDVASTSVDLPLIGHTTLSSALIFDTGVYLVVVGIVLMAFEAFGDEPAEAPT